MPNQGDIVLIPVPFTDLSSTKRRPVIVISNDDYNLAADDVVVVAMTSTPVTNVYSFTITASDLIHGTLKPTLALGVERLPRGVDAWPATAYLSTGLLLIGAMLLGGWLENKAMLDNTVVEAVGVAGGVEEAVKKGAASWLGYSCFGTLVLAYGFLIWYGYLGGYQWFA